MRLRTMILNYIKAHPGVDTRDVVNYFFKHAKIKKQRTCGYLSSLKRAHQIVLIVINPGRETYAY